MQFHTIKQHTRVCFVSSTGGCRKWRNANRTLSLPARSLITEADFAVCEKTGEFFFFNLHAIIYSFYLAEQLAATRVAHHGFSIRVTLMSVFSARL